jgi:hypothetical protein
MGAAQGDLSRAEIVEQGPCALYLYEVGVSLLLIGRRQLNDESFIISWFSPAMGDQRSANKKTNWRSTSSSWIALHGIIKFDALRLRFMVK